MPTCLLARRGLAWPRIGCLAHGLRWLGPVEGGEVGLEAVVCGGQGLADRRSVVAHGTADQDLINPPGEFA